MRHFTLPAQERERLGTAAVFLGRCPLGNLAAYRASQAMAGGEPPKIADLVGAGLTSAQLFDFAIHSLARGSAVRGQFLKACSRLVDLSKVS